MSRLGPVWPLAFLLELTALLIRFAALWPKGLRWTFVHES